MQVHVCKAGGISNSHHIPSGQTLWNQGAALHDNKKYLSQQNIRTLQISE